MHPTFQRARRPEQVAERRAAILTAARRLLQDHRLAEISLTEISAEVGLAKSNVLRYFESREAIYLEVLIQEWAAWLDDLDEVGRVGSPSRFRYAVENSVAQTLADTLVERPLLCELLSNLAGVLEHNISEDMARHWKAHAIENAVRLQDWLQRSLPHLGDLSARYLAGAVTLLTGALWSYERPSPAIAKVNAEFGGLPADPLATLLYEGLFTHLVGIVTQAEARAGRYSAKIPTHPRRTSR